MLAIVSRCGLRYGDCLCNSEIGDDGDVTREENIFGFDVAVDDTFPMRVLECARDVAQKGNRLACWKDRCLFDPLAKGFAANVRHRVVGDAVGNAGGEDGYDVRMLERCSQANFSCKALGAESRGEVAAQDFYDDVSAERDLTGEEDSRHAAAAELAFDGIGGPEGRLEAVAELHASNIRWACGRKPRYAFESAESSNIRVDVTHYANELRISGEPRRCARRGEANSAIHRSNAAPFLPGARRRCRPRNPRAREARESSAHECVQDSERLVRNDGIGAGLTGAGRCVRIDRKPRAGRGLRRQGAVKSLR